MAVEQLLGFLPKSWEYKTLGAVCHQNGAGIQTGPFGSQLHASDYVSAGIPSIMPQNIGDNKINVHGISRISLDDANRLSRYLVREGDIVYSRRGDVEKRALIRAPEDGWLCGTGCLRVRVDRNVVEPRYASYCLGHPLIRDWIVRHAHGATMPNLNTSILSACPFVIPPLLEQRAIAHILGTLDDKIELNRRMNETLEAMARALFKDWFVDFGPTRAKIQGRDLGLPQYLADLFPDRLVASELGEIPEGWEIGCVGDVLEQLRGKEHPITAPEAKFLHFSIPAFDNGQWPSTEPGRSIKSQKSVVPPGTILLSKINPEIERVWAADVRGGDRSVSSTEFLVLRPRGSFGRTYVYCLVRSYDFRQNIQALVTGTSKSHQRARAEAILDLPAVLPTARLSKSFEGVAEGFLIRTMENRRESRALMALRDALLPKLISGEVRVRETERAVEAVK